MDVSTTDSVGQQGKTPDKVPTVEILNGDCRSILDLLPDESVHCCVTSPPYFGLRDYGVGGQIGLEPTPDAFVAEMVAVFREVRRVLRPDGTLWLNLGDSYAGSWGNQGRKEGRGTQRAINAPMMQNLKPYPDKVSNTGKIPEGSGLKPKDLIGIPWRVAFALQADGWWLRSSIIWHKPNPMPESVRDRPTSAHENIFLLAKSDRYFYDHEAIMEPAVVPTWEDGSRVFGGVNKHGANAQHGDRTSGRRTAPRKSQPKGSFGGKTAGTDKPAFRHVAPMRNKRNVWSVSPKPFKEAHFATFPPDLIEPCILAGCPAGGTVLDPFFGAGTTGLVAQKHGRNCIGIELNRDYVAIAQRRLGLPVLSDLSEGIFG